jgi:hypothetical protein
MARGELDVKFNKQLSFFKRTAVSRHSLAGYHFSAARFDYVSWCLSDHQITAVKMLLIEKERNNEQTEKYVQTKSYNN